MYSVKAAILERSASFLDQIIFIRREFMVERVKQSTVKILTIGTLRVTAVIILKFVLCA